MRRTLCRTLTGALLLALFLLPPAARAAGVTVNSTTDVSDGDTSSIFTLIFNPGLDGVISLREAIEAANNTPGADTITFNIPGCPDVCVISPASALPDLTDDGTTIDGYSQPGATPATDTAPATLKIMLDGAGAGDVSGLKITSGGNLIRGLVIAGFAQHGIHITTYVGTGSIISGNYIGTDASGAVALGNSYHAVFIGPGQGNRIGGGTPAERNILSGNGGHGVHIVYDESGENTVSGNYIGTDASGTTPLPNNSGVAIQNGADSNTVGGDVAGERNVISGNRYYGVFLEGTTMSNTISGNYIGTDATATAAMSNTRDGVWIGDGTHHNTIGPDNVIAYNGMRGVRVYGDTTVGNRITQNSIFSNGATGIYLLGGANGGIAPPVISAANEGSVDIVGSACPGCTVEVFQNDDMDGEGKTYLGSATADPGGHFTVTASALGSPFLTATATGVFSGTSEFSEVFLALNEKVFLPLVLRDHD